MSVNTTKRPAAPATSGSRAFDALRMKLSTDVKLKTEVEHAFYILVGAANPSDRGQRFLYGNGAEWIMAAAAWNAGVIAAPMGHNADGFDLVDLLGDARGLWSVKASASASSGQIRLKNFMGSGEGVEWKEATLFVGPYFGGAVLVDPRIHTEVASRAKQGRDALMISSKAIRDFAQNTPANFVAFEVAKNDHHQVPDPAAFAKTILVAESFPMLSAPFTAAAPKKGQRSMSEELEVLKSLRDDGALDEQQYQLAVDRVLHS